jgi:hypothetical protein
MMSRGEFAECSGSRFRVAPDSEPELEVELVEVKSLGAPRPGDPGAREPFSLIFRGPVDRALPQRTYRMEHATLGAMDIFIVPVGPDEVGMRYQAIFA